MSRLTDLETIIDNAVTNATDEGSVTAEIVGTQLKAVAEYANDEGYSVYRAIISQNGGSAPTLIEFENTTGKTFGAATRTSQGVYTIPISGAGLNPNPDKCVLLIGSSNFGQAQGLLKYSMSAGEAIKITTADITNAVQDSLLARTAIQLLIYP